MVILVLHVLKKWFWRLHWLSQFNFRFCSWQQLKIWDRGPHVQPWLLRECL